MLFLGELVWVEEAANGTPSWDEGCGLSEDERDDFEEDDADIDGLRLEAGARVNYDNVRLIFMMLYILKDLCDDLES